MKKEDLNIIEYGNEKATLTANLIEKYISKISADMKGTKYIYK